MSTALNTLAASVPATVSAVPAGSANGHGAAGSQARAVLTRGNSGLPCHGRVQSAGMWRQRQPTDRRTGVLLSTRPPANLALCAIR